MHCLRRAALRSALSATRAVSTPRAIAPFAAVSSVNCNAARAASPQAIRFFSHTLRKASEDRQLEEAQRESEEEFDRQVVADARQDVEESVAQTEADIQEAMQEVMPEEPVPPKKEWSTETSVFLRNLVFEITEEHLQKAFSKYGDIESVFIARDPRGMSKGYGFVHFQTKEAMEEACKNVNGSFWHGRRVTCIPRQPKVEKESRSFKHHNSPINPTPQLYIGNIPYETTDAELNRLFRNIENITDVRVAVDRATGWPRGFAHVDFNSVDACMEAKNKLNGVTLGGRRLKLDYAHGYRKGENPDDKTSRSIFTPNKENYDSE